MIGIMASKDSSKRGRRKEKREKKGRKGRRREKYRKLYKIGEVMMYTGLSRQTIHNYTMLGLITEEARTEAGHRLYPEEVFDRIEKIQRLKRKKKTLLEIRKKLTS
jgi:hypothetical protein